MTHAHATSRPDCGDSASRDTDTDLAPLYLPNHVHACVTQGHCVFLDLKQDKYSAVPIETTRHISDPSDIDSGGVSLASQLEPHRADLLSAGVVTMDPSNARPIAATIAEPIEGHIFGLDDQRAFGLAGEDAKDLKITIGEMVLFLYASWRASRHLSSRHIERVVAMVRRRKAHRRGASTDIEHLRRLTAVFRRMRPWYPRKYLCLYDSLALLEFLATQHIHPTWVFGVQAQPFGAHCWVQHEGLLLNEGTEYAGRFEPVFAI